MPLENGINMEGECRSLGHGAVESGIEWRGVEDVEELGHVIQMCAEECRLAH